MYVSMKFMVTIGARMFTWPTKTNAMVMRLVKQIAATGVLLRPFYFVNQTNIFKYIFAFPTNPKVKTILSVYTDRGLSMSRQYFDGLVMK